MQMRGVAARGGADVVNSDRGELCGAELRLVCGVCHKTGERLVNAQEIPPV